MKSLTVTISGMACSGCAATVKEALIVLDGVKSAEVKLDKGTADISFDETLVQADTFEKAIEEAGYTMKGAKV